MHSLMIFIANSQVCGIEKPYAIFLYQLFIPTRVGTAPLDLLCILQHEQIITQTESLRNNLN